MWNDLTMSERADVIKMAVKAGLRDMKSIRDFYDNSLKYADGGPKVTYGKPYYSYDKNMLIETDNGKPILNYSATLPEVNIIPDSKKSPADRNADEGFRRKTFSDYDEHEDRGYTQRQIARSQNEWDNSTEKKVLQYGQGIASGIGIASDIVSGYPLYSTLKAERILSEAKTPMDYVEGGLWLLPGAFKTFKTLNNARKGIPNTSGLLGLSEQEAELERLRAIRRINGYPEDVNLSGMDDFADNVTTGLSQEAKEGLRRSTIDRNVRAIRQDYTTRQRINNPSNDHILEDLESIEKRYRRITEDAMEGVKVGRYSAEDYLLAGEDGTQGLFNGGRNFISLNKGAKDILKTEKHEGRHLIDKATLRTLTPRQERILESAYDSDFTQLPYVNRYKFLEGYENMGTERVTTNRDARDILLKQLKKDYKLKSIPDLATEDKLISTAKDWAIFDAVENSNGYGWAYIDWLKHIGELTPAKAQQFRQAMKHVGGVAAPIAIGASLSNQYAEGGSIHIAPSKRGTFTAAATKHGMGVQEFASKVLANKDNYSPTMVKKANFARNFGGHKHGLGGYLFEEGGPKNTNREYKSANSWSTSNLHRLLTPLSGSLMNFGKRGLLEAFYRNRGGTPEETYFLPKKIQRQEFLSRGYIEVPNDYGLVKKAVGNKDVPVYQTKKDDISREEVIPIGNIRDTWYGREEAALEHPGHYPTAIYFSPYTNEYYQKGWDLNDYGGGSGAYNNYDAFGKIRADIADAIGSPVVTTTGISNIGSLDKMMKEEETSNIATEFLKSKGLVPTKLPIKQVPSILTLSGKPLLDLKGEPVTYWEDEYVPTLPEVTIIGKRRKKVK